MGTAVSLLRARLGVCHCCGVHWLLVLGIYHGSIYLWGFYMALEAEARTVLLTGVAALLVAAMIVATALRYSARTRASAGLIEPKRAPLGLALAGIILTLDTLAESYPGREDMKGSIDLAITWLTEATRQAWRPDIPAMIQYLDRKFPLAGLGELAREAAAPFDPEGVDVNDFPPPFFRLIDPAQSVDKARIEAISNRIGRMTAIALHCDHIPLPGSFIPDLVKMSRFGAYSLTHAVLAARWTIENSCLLEPDLRPFLVDAAYRLKQLIDDPDAPYDLRVEAIAMLFYAGVGDQVHPRWLTMVLEKQQDDGGWTPAAGWRESHPHTTFLALWVLLEALYPDAPNVPMIQGRSSRRWPVVK